MAWMTHAPNHYWQHITHSIAVADVLVQVSFGPISWLLVGEIFPLSVRGQAAAFATFTNFGSNFLVGLATLSQCAAVAGTRKDANTYLLRSHAQSVVHLKQSCCSSEQGFMGKALYRRHCLCCR